MFVDNGVQTWASRPADLPECSRCGDKTPEECEKRSWALAANFIDRVFCGHGCSQLGHRVADASHAGDTAPPRSKRRRLLKYAKQFKYYDNNDDHPDNVEDVFVHIGSQGTG